MIRIYDGFYVGDQTDCNPLASDWCATVHACKHPCHQRVIGYHNSISPQHPNYLFWESRMDLYLNIIDPPQPLFKLETFTTALAFIKRHWHAGNPILIHCNQGESRAPSIALLFLASETGIITNASYDQATAEFIQLYPKYKPGQGIQTFLRQHWLDLMAH